MRDTDGVEWLLATEAARRVQVEASTIRTWVSRGKVAGRTIRRRLWVRMPDVWDAEHATRGRFLDQRARRVRH